MNGRIRSEGLFDEVYVPPAPHDGGTSLGAALLLWHQGLRRNDRCLLRDAYLGPEFTDEEIRVELQRGCIAFEYCSDPSQRAAEYIAKGLVVGWFQGRMEFGPRALGNRSILADPRNEMMRQTVNEKVKNRELFRPFGASVMSEDVQEYFDLRAPAPFMLEVCSVLPHYRMKLPSVTHVDGTTRPHTVERATNPQILESSRAL